MKNLTKTTCLLFALIFSCIIQYSQATKLVELKVVDKDYLLVYFVDGEVVFVDDASGSTAYSAHNHENGKNMAVRYGAELNVLEAANIKNWKIISKDDTYYIRAGKNPLACYRKSKLNGMAEMEWLDKDYVYDYTMAHCIYLKLPQSMIQGKTYTLEISGKTNTDVTTKTFTFDVYNCVSEAIHTNLVGYLHNASIKAADLYLWMGDGGARDYSGFEGKKVIIYNVDTKTSKEVGKVEFWKKNAEEAGGYNLIASDVWKADFTGFMQPGNYRLVIEDVGCSQDFKIGNDVYFEPYRVSTLGFFYMRIGQDNFDMKPVPRRPLWLPYKSPENTRVYITTMHPYHPEWKTFSRGDVWDRPEDWVKYKKAGNPENSNAYGGHSDALDWDRHLGHVSIIYDMLLPFILTNGAISDDNLGIAESGNKIPDILDEARNEVDFWLRLRDGKGYGHGLTNPDKENALYQAENTAIAAWANAANSAMLSDCFQIAGLTGLMITYRDSAIAAYNYAGSLPDPMLDTKQEVGDATFRGRDFKMMAAAYLYNVTANTVYEDVIKAESAVNSETPVIANKNLNQLWATAAYLMTKHTVHYPELQRKMKSILISEAKTNEANYSEVRPSRRANDNNSGYFKTIQNVQRCLIAHAITDNAADKAFFENAIILEADWGLGRNPLNIIQMTTATTNLATKRSVENIYTSGRNDGSQGLHPGHTPYLNTDDWAPGMIMGRPSWMTSKCYPAYDKWAKAEGYFNTRYVWSHSEFTPQQTMRGKMALYGYLYGINK